MDKIALAIAVLAILATFIAANSSSVRNESHQQVNNIHALLKEISDITHRYFENYITNTPEGVALDQRKANTYEAVCNMKLNLLESSLTLLVRRCSSYFFYDANSPEFLDTYIIGIGSLRDKISEKAYLTIAPHSSIFTIDASLTSLYSDLNYYIGDRFRPIFEKAAD